MPEYNHEKLREAIRHIAAAGAALRAAPDDMAEIADAADQLEDITAQLVALIPPWCSIA